MNPDKKSDIEKLTIYVFNYAKNNSSFPNLENINKLFPGKYTEKELNDIINKMKIIIQIKRYIKRDFEKYNRFPNYPSNHPNITKMISLSEFNFIKKSIIDEKIFEKFILDFLKVHKMFPSYEDVITRFKVTDKEKFLIKIKKYKIQYLRYCISKIGVQPFKKFNNTYPGMFNEEEYNKITNTEDEEIPLLQPPPDYVPSSNISVGAPDFVPSISISVGDLKKDDYIECYYEDEDEDENGWFKATIIKVNDDGTYNVRYDTKHIENNVIKERIRKINKITEELPSKRNRNYVDRYSPPQSSTKIKRKRYSLEDDANIILEFASKVNELEDLYDDANTILQFASSSFEEAPSTVSSSIAPLSTVSSSSVAPSGFDISVGDLKKDDYIECYYEDEDENGWFKATIIKVNRDGTYNVRYDTKHTENNVIKERIRKINKVTEELPSKRNLTSDGKRKSLKRKSLKRKSNL